MKTYLDCIPCFIRQALEAARMVTRDEAVCEQVLRRVLDLAAAMDMRRTPPEMAQQIHRIIREISGIADPYLEVKNHFNRLALDMLPGLENRVESSADPFDTAVRLALAGNIIDFGTPGTMAAADVSKTVEESLTAPLHGWSTARMKKAVDQAGKILYLGDNAGEIVFDRLLIEQIGSEKVTFVVRSGPAINDALKADADDTGISDMVPVIESGADAPGTPLSLCSPEFLSEIQATDLVISKGQGNYETLSDLDRPVFFLFRVKCPLVSRHLNLPQGTLVIEGRNQKEPA
jgi:uncharacterized protein with ATP-grasp and redox domains